MTLNLTTSFASPLAWLFVPPQSRSLADRIADQIATQFQADPFAGLQQFAAFDWAMVIPYFVLLGVLSVYGLHRYEMIRGYFKHRAKLAAAPLRRFSELPRVTIQLPIYNERFVVERLLESVSRVDYPWDRLQIQVLDDSTDATHPFTQALVRDYQESGLPIEYIHRTNRHGFKAGALESGLKTATGEFVAVFDADFVIPSDFLRRTIHHFTDEKVGMVQTRWTYLNRDYNVLTEVQAMLLDGHFILEHVARSGGGMFFNFNGTAGIMRKTMIADAGGWQHDTLTEDSDLSYRAQLNGWKFVYDPNVECPSELPVETYGFQVQQSRWAKGLTQVAKKLLLRILRADLPWRLKAEAFFHLTPNVSYPLMVGVSALMLPVMIVRYRMGWFEMALLDLPLMIAAFWSVSAFYVVAQRALHPDTWKRSLLFMPALLAAGIALTLINSKAFFEAIIGRQSAFARTPKYAIGQQKGSAPVSTEYRRRSGWLPYLELAMGFGFVLIVLYAIESLNFLAVPFLLLFVGGYFWAGLTTLWDEYQGKLAFERAREAHAREALERAKA